MSGFLFLLCVLVLFPNNHGVYDCLAMIPTACRYVDRGVVVPQFRLLSARHIVSWMYCDSYALYGSGIRLWRVSVMSRALFRGVALIKK